MLYPLDGIQLLLGVQGLHDPKQDTRVSMRTMGHRDRDALSTPGIGNRARGARLPSAKL